MFKVMQPKIKNKLNYVKINKSYLDECGFVLIESVLNRGGLIIEKGGGAYYIIHITKSEKSMNYPRLLQVTLHFCWY